MPEPEINSPEWWIKRLHKRLTDHKPLYQHYSRYYEGEHKLKFATSKFRQAFGNLLANFSDNWCGLVPDAVEERLTVEGFRLPSGEGPNPWQADTVAWDHWQRNNLDAGSMVLHTEALVNGCASVLVWPENGDDPLVTVESPEQMIVDYLPGTRTRVAALKEWWDDWEGYVFATLYRPDGVWKYRSERPVRSANDLGQSTNIQWLKREVAGEEWPLSNPMGVVPVVEFENRPRMLRPPSSEIKTVIPLQDAVNKLCVDLIVASEFEGFRQRWATGLDIPVDPVTKKPLDTFEHAINRLWYSKDKDTKFGDFQVADLTNFVAAIEMFVQHVASQTRTPPHYFYLKGQFPSGESIKSAETGLVSKTRRKMRIWGEAWEEVLRLVFLAAGDRSRAEIHDSETIWGDPESRSEAEHADALVKKQALGVPDEQLWEDDGYTPQQIERFLEMRKRQAADQPPALMLPGVPAPPALPSKVEPQ